MKISLLIILNVKFSHLRILNVRISHLKILNVNRILFKVSSFISRNSLGKLLLFHLRYGDNKFPPNRITPELKNNVRSQTQANHVDVCPTRNHFMYLNGPNCNPMFWNGVHISFTPIAQIKGTINWSVNDPRTHTCLRDFLEEMTANDYEEYI